MPNLLKPFYLKKRKWLISDKLKIIDNDSISNLVFSLRYIEYKGTKTGFVNDPGIKDKYIHMEKNGQITYFGFDGAYNLLKNM